MAAKGMKHKRLGTYGYTKLGQCEVSDEDDDEKKGKLLRKTGVNVFEMNSDDEPDDTGEVMSMKALTRGCHDGGAHVEVYEIDISGAHGSESLQKIALKYSCSVWELKRVNNLLNAQDFHALNKIRIPAMENSYRAELLQRDGRLVNLDDGAVIISMPRKSSEGSMDNGSWDGIEMDHLEEGLSCQRDQLFRTISIRDTIANDSESGDQFLRHMDHDLARLRETVDNMKGSLDEVTHSLTEPRFQPLSGPSSRSLKGTLIINGVDCGIAWRTVICCGVFVAVILPASGILFYFLS